MRLVFTANCVFAALIALVGAENATKASQSSSFTYMPSIYAADADTNKTTSDNATWASQALYKACKGAGTDEQAIIDILGPMEPQTRYRVATRFRELYNKRLKTFLQDDTSDYFADLLGKIGVPLPEMEHDILWQVHASHNEVSNTYENQPTLVPLFIGRSPDEIETFSSTFKQLEGRDLVEFVYPMLMDDVELVLMPWIKNEIPRFDAVVHTLDKAEQDAKALYKAGKGKFLGTDEKGFIKVIMQSPREHLQNISIIYERNYHQSLVDVIDDEFSDMLDEALVQHVHFMLESPIDALAHVFYRTMAGAGSDEIGLNNAIVRYFQLLPEINGAYQRQYSASLRYRIYDETSGYYRKMLLRMFDSAIPYTPSSQEKDEDDVSNKVMMICIGGAIAAFVAIVCVLIVLKRQRRCCWYPHSSHSRPKPKLKTKHNKQQQPSKPIQPQKNKQKQPNKKPPASETTPINGDSV